MKVGLIPVQAETFSVPESPELEERVVKLQKDVEEIKEDLQDNWHQRRELYEGRVRKALEGNSNACQLFLEIDNVRSIKEIEDSLRNSGRAIPHVSLWRAAQAMLREGIIRKIDIKGISPIYAKKPWAKPLNIDDYVRARILGEQAQV